MNHTFFIVNPASHGGAGAKAWEAFLRSWPTPIDPKHVIFTERPGHSREIASSVTGYDTIAAVGGDGTVGDVNSGILDRDGDRPNLAIVPAGTGNDIARNVGINSIDDAVSALKNKNVRAFDLIRADFHEDGRRGHRYAFLSIGVGFSAVPKVKPWMKRLLGPKGAYYLGTFIQILVYRSPHFTVLVDGNERCNTNGWMVIIANVESSSGGSMCIGPGASSVDGELNITIFPATSKFTMVTRLLPKVSSGEQVNEPGVQYFPGKKIEVVSHPPAILDFDGDVFGTTPATISVCPGMFQVLTPKAQAFPPYCS